MRFIAVVGMAGAGKSEAARLFVQHGYHRIRFGELTMEEIKRRGLPINEANERLVRESLRKEHGPAAFAKLNFSKIDAALKHQDVVADGLYSWEELKLLREHYGDCLKVVAVWASPATRYGRLMSREIRPLTLEEATSRDAAEIEISNKGGPIAMADFTVLNEGDEKELQERVEDIIYSL